MVLLYNNKSDQIRIYFLGSGFVRFQTSEAADACLQKSDDDKVKKYIVKTASTMTFFF